MVRLYLAGCILCVASIASAGVQDQAELQRLLDTIDTRKSDTDLADMLSDIATAGVRSPKAVPRLEPFLEHESASVRVEAARALRSVGAEESLVRAMLKDRDPTVRADLALYLLADDEPPEDFLHMLYDPAPEVRAALAAALLDAGIDSNRLRRLLQDDAGEVRATAALLLIKDGEAPHNFLGLLKDPAPIVRSRLAMSLVDAGVEHERLRPLLKDQDASVRAAVGYALMKVNSEPVWECVVAWLDAPYKIERYETFRALGPVTRIKLTPLLFDRLSSDNEKQRSRSLRVLKSLKEIQREFHNRVREMAASEHEEIRQGAANLAAQLSDQDLIEVLRLGLKDPATSIRISAATAARRRKCVQLLPELKQLYNSENVEFRMAVASAVAVLDQEDQQCVQVMIDALKPKDGKSMASVCSALRFTGTRALAAKSVVRQSMDPPKLQHSLFDIMGNMDPPGLNVLESLDEHGLPWVREWMADEELSDKVKSRIFSYLFFRGRHNEELEPQILKFLKATDSESLQADALSVLAKTGVTDPEQLKPFSTWSTDSELARSTAQALGRCRGDSKALGRAIRMLQDMLSHGDPRVRFTVCRELHEHRAIDVTALDSLTEWLQEFSPPSDQSVTDMLAWIGPKAKPAVVELLQQIEASRGPTFPTRAVRAVGMDPVAEIISGLSSPHPTYRRACAEAAGELKDPRLVPALVETLSNPDVSSHHDKQAHAAVLHAIAEIGASEELIPLLTKLVREPHSIEAASRVLATFGPKARPALPILMRHKIRWVRQEEIEIARAIARIEQSPLGLVGVRRCLRQTTGSPQYYNLFFDELIDLIVELEERSLPLTDRLIEIVEGLEFMHPRSRIHAAYALARLQPDEPRWRTFIESWQSVEPGTVTSRLKQLDSEPAASEK